MTFFESAKEIFQKVVETTKEDKKYDEKLVLQETKQNLLDLKEDVSYATTVLEELKKTGWVDQVKFQALEAKLRDETHKKEAVSEISTIVEDIYKRYDTLHVDEKEKVRTMTDALRASKEGLSGLKKEILNGKQVDYMALEKKLSDEATEKLNKHWYSQWLVGPYRDYIHQKVEKLKGEKKEADDNWIGKLKNSISDWFFGLVGSMFIGKELVASITDLIQINKEKIAKAKEGVDDVVKKGKEVVENLSPEQLEKKEKSVRSYIVMMMQKYGKPIDAATLDRVMKRINIKKLAADDTPEMQKLFSSNWEDANLATSLFETVTLPFHTFYELLSALQAEGVVSYGDIAYHVSGDVLSYGLKGFKLFGSGIQVATGHISMKDVADNIAHVYNKSPDAARELIWAMIYRTQHSPIFQFAMNTGETLAKAALWPLVESKKDAQSLKNILDGYHGHMTSAVENMEKFVKYLPPGDTPYLQSLISDFKGAVGDFKDMNNLNLIVKDLKQGSQISVAELQKEYATRGWGNSKYLDALKAQGTVDMRYDQFTSHMQGYTKSIGEHVRLNLNKRDMFQKAEGIWSKVKSGVKFQPNEFAIMEDGLTRLEHASLAYSDMMNNRGWFKGAKDTRAGLKGGILNMKESLGTGKTFFNFHTAQDFEQFMKKAKYMAKQSPETLKFLIGKTPIMMIGGMALSGEGTMSDKMKELFNDMRALVPILGPIMIIQDASNAGKLIGGDPSTWGEMGLGVTLITTDVIKIAKYITRKERGPLMEYVFQPVTDVRDIGVFMARTGKNTVVLTKDFINVAKNKGFAELGESIWKYFRSEGRLGRIGLATGLVVGGYLTWDYLFSSNDLDEGMKKQLTTYKDHPEQLDADIQKQWPTLSQGDKNDYLRAAVLRQGGFAPELIGKINVENTDNNYTIVLPSIISRNEVNALKGLVGDALAKVQPGSHVTMQFLGEARYHFTKDLSQQFADMSLEEKKQKMSEYVHSMGYENADVVLDIESIS